MGEYLATGKIPRDIELIHLPTHYVDGRPQLTGEMHRFPTQRHMSQILNMMVRTRKAWAKIEELCKEELI
jgi:predicted translin family RNA/ssDNA-binding protein